MALDKIGRYEIKAELGRGGMGTVYRAYDPRFKRDVALKVLPRQFVHHPTFRARFKREARVIASLEHPAIVAVYDFGEQDEQLYLVMRFMSRGSLAERLKNVPLSLSETIRIVTHLAPALDEAHAKGIIHRDLKPANILFDQRNKPYVADFGIAKLTEGTAHLTGTAIIGTPAYMSPEQVHGDRALDGRSDIYALGIILFEMLTARKPYQAETSTKLMMKHVLDPVPNVLTVKADLPSGCRTVIDKAMAKEPDARYQTARAMASALENVLNNPNQPSNGKTGLRLPLMLGLLLAILLLVIGAFLLLRSDEGPEDDVSAITSTIAPSQHTAVSQEADMQTNSTEEATSTPIVAVAQSTAIATFTLAPRETPVTETPPPATSTLPPTSTPIQINSSTSSPSNANAPPTPVPGQRNISVSLLSPAQNETINSNDVQLRVQVNGFENGDRLQLRAGIDQNNLFNEGVSFSFDGSAHVANLNYQPGGFGFGQTYLWQVLVIGPDGRTFSSGTSQFQWDQPGSDDGGGSTGSSSGP